MDSTHADQAMRIVRCYVSVVLCVFVLTGCASNWHTTQPESVQSSTYASFQSPLARGVGKLRKLFMVRVDFPVPEVCSGQPGRQSEVVLDTSSYKHVLEHEKGYELFRPTDADAVRLRSVLGDQRDVLKRLVAGADKVAEDFASADVIRAVREILTGYRVDGLILLEIRHDCALSLNPATRFALGVMTLGMSEVSSKWEFKKVDRSYRATIFEAATARTVWQSSYPWPRQVVRPEQLFAELENAVPALLTK